MTMTAEQLVHRLLFQALLEMRSESHESGNKVVFHLADLFHNPSIMMEKAAIGDPNCGYDDVLEFLKKRAQEKGIEKWLEQRMEQIESRDESGVVP